MKILVINAGSSSLKYKLFDMESRKAIASGIFERIGKEEGHLTHKRDINGQEEVFTRQQKIKDHRSGMHLAMALITGRETGVIDSISRINAIGHRVVQGGEDFRTAVLIDNKVKQAIVANTPLAPLHNPANLNGIEVAENLLPGIPNVAVFDTEFHHTIPRKAFLYGLPYEYYTLHKVRKYGFHGTSHKYVTNRAARLMGTRLDALNLISIHLGNGCSICAVEKGECRDTSMGMTPLAGVMMGTRTGDMDPAVIRYLVEQTGMTVQSLDDVLNTRSGLKGICGYNDMRDIHEARKKGDDMADLAVEMFCYQIKKYIGAYTAVLGTLDALIFTAGVGENDAVIREKACGNLSSLGILIDPERNENDNTLPRSVHAADSRVQVWVIPTDEELQIAIETERILAFQGESR